VKGEEIGGSDRPEAKVWEAEREKDDGGGRGERQKGERQRQKRSQKKRR
jgi:hypothetical protein